MGSKDTLHALIEQLPETEIENIEHMLRAYLIDPMRCIVLEPIDDDNPLEEDEKAALADARAEEEDGEYYTLEEVEAAAGSDEPRPWQLRLSPHATRDLDEMPADDRNGIVRALSSTLAIWWPWEDRVSSSSL